MGRTVCCELAHIDLGGLDARLQHTQLDAAVNWHNQLLGPLGVARVHGPQKGATPAQVVEMEAALHNFARHLHRATGIDVSLQPGSGASGGPGAASNHAAGIDAYTSTLREPCSLDDAFRQAGPWLADATEQALRMVAIGMGLGAEPMVLAAARPLGSIEAV